MRAPSLQRGGSVPSIEAEQSRSGHHFVSPLLSRRLLPCRLSEDPEVRVLLLEEGTFSQDSQGQGRRPDWIVEQISTPRHDYRTWAIPTLTQQIRTEADPALNNRSGILLGPVVTGKAVGGSTVRRLQQSAALGFGYPLPQP